MIKLFLKLIGFLFFVAIIALLTIVFVPSSISTPIKDWSNSAWQEVVSSQEVVQETPSQAEQLQELPPQAEE